MQQIYAARDDMEAHFVQSLLEVEGIPLVIQREAMEGVWSTVRVSSNSLPGVWVGEADYRRVRRRDKKHAGEPESEEAPATSTWKCPKCDEEVEDQFDEIWNCGAAKAGTEESAEASPQLESRDQTGN